MKNENTNELKKMLEEQKQTPTYGDSFKLMLLTSIATSLACIADAIMKDEEVKPIYCDTDSLKEADKMKIKQILNEQCGVVSLDKEENKDV